MSLISWREKCGKRYVRVRRVKGTLQFIQGRYILGDIEGPPFSQQVAHVIYGRSRRRFVCALRSLVEVASELSSSILHKGHIVRRKPLHSVRTVLCESGSQVIFCLWTESRKTVRVATSAWCSVQRRLLEKIDCKALFEYRRSKTKGTVCIWVKCSLNGQRADRGWFARLRSRSFTYVFCFNMRKCNVVI